MHDVSNIRGLEPLGPNEVDAAVFIYLFAYKYREYLMQLPTNRCCAWCYMEPTGSF